MNGILDKFGLYDFMGIWGPGAITVTYYWFTLSKVWNSLVEWLELPPGSISQTNQLVLLYTVVAYIVGAALHELGKIIADATSMFNLSNAKDSCGKKRKDLVLRTITKKYSESIDSVIMPDEVKSELFRAADFEKAISYLKYTESISTKRIDKYHSIYALFRSLTLCFSIHTPLIAVYCAMIGNVWEMIIFAAVDLALTRLFFIRTYRYFVTWINNVFIQYCLLKEKDSNPMI